MTGPNSVVMLVERGEGDRLVVGAPVYISGEQTVALAQADSEVRARAVGFISPVPSTMTHSANLCTTGSLWATLDQWDAVLASSEERIGTSEERGWLLIGRTYYLDAWTAGRITSRKPRLPGQWVVELGIATSRDVLRINIKPPILIPHWYPFELVTFAPTEIEESPWNRGDEWTGHFLAVGAELDNSAPALLVAGDVRPAGGLVALPRIGDPGTGDRRSDLVDRVLALRGRYEYDETVAGVARLKDGRYVSWESYVDATGSGFHADAYGGDADIFLSATARGAWLAISEQTRESLRFATLPSEEAIVGVLHDRYLEHQLARPISPNAQMLKGELAPDGSDGDANAAVPAPIGSVYTQMSTPYHVWVMTQDGWEPNGLDVGRPRITARRAELIRIATASGELGDLVEPRIDELIRHWDAHYEEMRSAEQP